MYLGELRLHWRPLVSASLGLGLGLALIHYTASLFGPPMIAEFGWSRAQFALLGSLPLVTLLFVPFAGRFTDRHGPRVSAMVGFTVLPLGFVAMTLTNGSLIAFFIVWGIQHVFGILTTALVFCRLVVERFDRARGFALSLLMTMPPLAGAIAAPLLGRLIDSQGWRAGFYALAATSLVGGIVAIGMMRRGGGPDQRRAAADAETASLPLSALFALLRNRALLMLLAGMFLVNLPQVIASSQLKLVLGDLGLSPATATWMLSLYAGGVIVGRFICGLALDRFPAHLVAIATLGLPAIGYVLLGFGFTAQGMIFLAIALIGLAQGAEGDLGAFFVSRQFAITHFSLLLSLVTAIIGIGAAVGASLLSLSLHLGTSYSPFLLLSAGGTVVGAALFAFTGVGGRNAAPAADALAIEQANTGELQ